MAVSRWISRRAWMPTAGFSGKVALAAVLAAAFMATFAAQASWAVSFGTTHQYNDGGDTPLSVGVGDFNEDGRSDVVAANDGGTTSLMLNDGSGAFSLASGWPKSAGPSSGSLVVGDFNEDNHADVAVANRRSGAQGTVTVQLGDGSGGVLSTSTFTLAGDNQQPFFIAKGDFNEDGHEDLLTANQNTSNISLLLGDGAGNFSDASGSPFAVGNTPRGLAVGDVNNDGHLDVVVSNENADTVSVLLGDGAGGFSAGGGPYSTGDAPRQVTLGDFNNDGNLDFATANSGEPGQNNTVSVYLGDGTGSFTQASSSPFPTGTSPFSIATGDFDGDGNLDIVTANRFPSGSPSRDNMSVLIGNGSGGFAAPVSVPSSSTNLAPTSVAVGDFNNDGKPDLVMNEAFGPTIVVALNTTTPSTPTITASTPNSPANDNNPSIKGTAAAGTTVHLYTTSDCSGTEVTSGSAAAFASPGISVSVADDSSTTFYAAVTNHAGWKSACSSGFTYVEDSTPPAAPTNLATTPASPGHTRTPLVSGTAEAASTVKIYKSADCSGSPAATGTASQFASGISVTVTRNATTPLSATASDSTGNTSACSSSIDYTEAGTPVPTGLATSPASPGRDTSPRITGTAEAGSTVKLYTSSDCSGSEVATGTAAAFASPGIVVSVPSGTTGTFRATATDSDGNVSPCSDPVSYTQDDTGTSTYFVRQGGTGSACTQANPCGTIANALISHRFSPTPGDVIDVGAGTFVGSVEANDPADDGLTIRGTLGGGGSRDTTIRSSANGTNNCDQDGGCAVVLGASPDAAVTLRDVNVDTVGAAGGITPLEMHGGSDLADVHASARSGANPGQIVWLGDDAGTAIDHSTIDASGTGAVGIETNDGGFDMTDSHVTGSCCSDVVAQYGSAGGKITLTRTWVEGDPNNFSNDLYSVGDVTVDSSLMTGGEYGIYFGDGSNGGTLRVQSSTIDAAQPGSYDCCGSVYVDGFGSSDPVDLTVANSILVEDLYADGYTGSVTCLHSDMPSVYTGSLTDNCAIGSDGNTSTDPSNLFVGGSPFSWQLKPDAPAVDAGEPGAVDPQFSQTDLAGNPRRQAGTSASCPDGVVDMGAYERLDAPCGGNRPTITGGSSPVAGVKLNSTTGQWAGTPTGYQAQWLRCNASGNNCNPASPYQSSGKYTPVSADAGHTLRVQYIAVYANGDRGPAISDPSGVVATSVPVNSRLPSISGGASPMVGVKLSSVQGGWSGDPTSYQVQWLRCDAGGGNCSAVASATSRNYTPVGADLGHALRVRYIATNPAGDSAPATSDPTGATTQPPPTNVQPPVLVNGSSPHVGVKMATTPGSWTGNPTSYQTQWLRCDSGGGNCSPVTAYRASSGYIPVVADVGSTMKARYIATNASGDSSPATSAASGVVGS